MSEHTIRLVIDTPDNTPKQSRDLVERIIRDMEILHHASPFHLSLIKRELKKFSCKSMKWNKE